MADFHSLLSVFRDATAPDSSLRGSIGDTAQNPVTNEARKDDAPANANTSNKIDPISTSDPSYSAATVKQNVERLLRIHSIRKSTAGATKCHHESGDTRDSVHIAVCATIVQEFPHEALWKKWIEETGGDIQIYTDEKSHDSSINIKASAQLYVHAKQPESIQSTWLKSKTLPLSHRPNWNDVRIIRAMLSLLEAALSDDKTTHILFCTESCVPVVTLREAALSLLLDKPCVWKENDSIATTEASLLGVADWDKSYIDCYDRNNSRCSRFDEHNCWGHLRDSIPAEAVYKALPGWCLLSRKHAQAILNLPSQLNNMNLWPAFEKVWAPEEVYFPTALNICGLIDEVVKRTVTHSKWDHKAINLQDRAHPFCYDGQFDDELVCQVRSDGCLFLRKMKQSIDINVWQDIVIHRKRARDRKVRADSYCGVKRERDWDHDRRGGRDEQYHTDHHRDRGSSYHHRRDNYNDRGRHGSNKRYDDDKRRNGSGRYPDEPHWMRRR